MSNDADLSNVTFFSGKGKTKHLTFNQRYVLKRQDNFSRPSYVLVE